MDKKKLFNKYYYRLVWEGVIKACICSFIVGFGATIVPASVAVARNNFNNGNDLGFWIALGLGAAVMVLSVPLFYLLFFRPKTKDMVARIDRLDMDQRLITMLELEKDESYMAMLQREDAKERLKAIKAKQLKFAVFVLPVVILALTTFCSTAMVGVTVTEFDSRIPWQTVGKREASEPEIEVAPIPEPEEQPDAEVTYFKVVYQVIMGAGHFDGDIFQVVEKGDNTTTVTAVPMSGWAFAYWDMEAFDEDDPQKNNPVRVIKNVRQDHLLWAKFQPADEEEKEGESDNKKPNPDNSKTQEDKESAEGDPNRIVEDDERYDHEKYWQKYFDEAMKKLIEADYPDDLKAMLESYWSYLWTEE